MELESGLPSSSFGKETFFQTHPIRYLHTNAVILIVISPFLSIMVYNAGMVDRTFPH
jgi:hypothetical protein